MLLLTLQKKLIVAVSVSQNEKEVKNIDHIENVISAMKTWLKFTVNTVNLP